MKKGFSKRHCPKCNGNIYFEPDYNASSSGQELKWLGWCLQCGYTLHLQKQPAPIEELSV